MRVRTAREHAKMGGADRLAPKRARMRTLGGSGANSDLQREHVRPNGGRTVSLNSARLARGLLRLRTIVSASRITCRMISFVRRLFEKYTVYIK